MNEEEWKAEMKKLASEFFGGELEDEADTDKIKQFLESPEVKSTTSQYVKWVLSDLETIHANKIQGFVAHFDILGFRSMIQNNDLDAVMLTYEQLQRTHLGKFYNEALKKEVVVTLNYSDTFLLYTTEISDESFQVLLEVCKSLFMAAYAHKVPLRGAVTVGELYSSHTAALGKPIVEAYEKEIMQDWIGCWISQECIDKISPETLEQLKAKTLIKYPIPLKRGPVAELYALNWTTYLIFLAKQNLDKFLNGGFFEKKENHGWAEEQKHKNTKDFFNLILSRQELEGTV